MASEHFEQKIVQLRKLAIFYNIGEFFKNVYLTTTLFGSCIKKCLNAAQTNSSNWNLELFLP